MYIKLEAQKDLPLYKSCIILLRLKMNKDKKKNKLSINKLKKLNGKINTTHLSRRARLPVQAKRPV